MAETHAVARVQTVSPRRALFLFRNDDATNIPLLLSKKKSRPWSLSLAVLTQCSKKNHPDGQMPSPLLCKEGSFERDAFAKRLRTGVSASRGNKKASAGVDSANALGIWLKCVIRAA